MNHFIELVVGNLHITMYGCTVKKFIQENPTVECRIDIPIPKEVVKNYTSLSFLCKGIT